MDWFSFLAIGLVGLFFLVLSPRYLFGLVSIRENEVGIVVKKFARKTLPPGELIAVNGEAGLQADMLAPGWHFGYYLWQYSVAREKLTVIPKEQLGLVIARGGKSIPNERIFGKVVPSSSFQDVRAFLQAGGEKGRQLGMLTAGVYRINTAFFEIQVCGITKISADQVGIVTSYDGAPVAVGEIAGGAFYGHNGFQDAQKFIELGGQKGLQEEVILAGSWNLNPWFVSVEIVPVTQIPLGSVGVVTSLVGKPHQDISGDSFKHGDLVEQGHKGVWAEPLYPGKHPLNTKTTRIEVVPTTNIALNWASNRSESHKLDVRLSSITVRSKDGFSFTLDVTQIIHVGAREASKVISRFGSMSNLVDFNLEPAIGSYFRNSAQDYTVLDFLSARAERAKDALRHIREALAECNIEVVDTYIGDIIPPAELMKTQTDRKLAEESKLTYAMQEQAQKQKQSFSKEEALAEIQGTIVTNEQNVRVAEFQAASAVKKAEGEATSIKLRAAAEAEALNARSFAEATATERNGRASAGAVEAMGLANAKGYEAGVTAMGQENFGKLQVMKVIGSKQIKVTPDSLVVGGGVGEGTPGLLMSAMMANLLQDQKKKEKEKV